MIRPWRSAKCSGTSFQPSAPKKYGPPKSIAIASAHERALSGAVEERGADQQRRTPIAVADPKAGRRLAQVRIVVAGDPEQRDVGTPARPRRRRRTRAPSRRRPRERRARRRGAPPSRRRSPGGRRPPRDRRRWSATRSRSTTTTARASTSRPLAIPSQVGSSAMSCVHWVIARTKTRSKNSSSGVTDSPWRRVALIRARACSSRSPSRAEGCQARRASRSRRGSSGARRRCGSAAGGAVAGGLADVRVVDLLALLEGDDRDVVRARPRDVAVLAVLAGGRPVGLLALLDQLRGRALACGAGGA